MTNFGELQYTSWAGSVRVIFQGHVDGAAGVSGLPEVDERVLARLDADLFVSAKR